MLVWDSFCGHLTDALKDLLARQNVDIAVIPGGLALVLQSLDKCINKPFKTAVRAHYQAWMVNDPFTYTPSGKKWAPSKELVLQWNQKAWDEIPADLVAKAFKSCGILTHLMALKMMQFGMMKLEMQEAIATRSLGFQNQHIYESGPTLCLIFWGNRRMKCNRK